MKIHLPFTKALVISMFILGFVLPATAEQNPHSYNSMNNNIIDWGDEFDQTSHSKPVKTDMSGPKNPMNYASDKMPNMQNGPVVDWWDEFEHQDSKKPASETITTSKTMNSEQLFDEYWDWESLQSM